MLCELINQHCQESNLTLLLIPAVCVHRPSHKCFGRGYTTVSVAVKNVPTVTRSNTRITVIDKRAPAAQTSKSTRQCFSVPRRDRALCPLRGSFSLAHPHIWTNVSQIAHSLIILCPLGSTQRACGLLAAIKIGRLLRSARQRRK